MHYIYYVNRIIFCHFISGKLICNHSCTKKCCPNQKCRVKSIHRLMIRYQIGQLAFSCYLFFNTFLLAEGTTLPGWDWSRACHVLPSANKNLLKCTHARRLAVHSLSHFSSMWSIDKTPKILIVMEHRTRTASNETDFFVCHHVAFN
jgi:hypothetical protein